MTEETYNSLGMWGVIFRRLVEQAEKDGFHFEVDASTEAFYVTQDGCREVIW